MEDNKWLERFECLISIMGMAVSIGSLIYFESVWMMMLSMAVMGIIGIFVEWICKTSRIKAFLAIVSVIAIPCGAFMACNSNGPDTPPAPNSLISNIPSSDDKNADEEVSDNDEGVYICTGGSSKRYHSYSGCRGLNRCSGDIDRISVSEAEDMGRTPCKICAY